MNLNAVDQTLSHLIEVEIPDRISPQPRVQPTPPKEQPAFVRDVLGRILVGRGDEVPVSAMPIDGTFPTGTSRLEKRNLAQEVPVWDEDLCIQCGKCVLVCPHAVIRSKVYDRAFLELAPTPFKSREARLPEWKGLCYTLQVAVEDCTGCGICVDVCPVRSKSEARLKAINMRPQLELRESERQNWDFFLSIPDRERRQLSFANVREAQVAQPLFEFSGACAGCGETPYIKLLTQLFGDRLLIANATGCSSIYGGNLPTTPYAAGSDGCGPAWSNSLFEDAAEFGLGFRVSLDKQREFAEELLVRLGGQVTQNLVNEILAADQRDAAGVFAQRQRVTDLKRELERLQSGVAMRLLSLADTLVRKSVWIVGGDGWGYDIGYGGLDHVLASGRNVKVLLLDTEVYSNTGGQCSKSTPLGAVAKFASAGKRTPKKDLGLIAMSYGNIYVASVAMGAKDEHTLKSFLEAEAYDGPALIIAYSHCIAHGINMTTAMQNQKAAVLSGQWLLYRYHPEQVTKGETPLHVDSAAPKLAVEEYFNLENRFNMLSKSRPTDAKRLFQEAQKQVDARWQSYQQLARSGLPNERECKNMNLSTQYLGMKLRTPLVPSASPLSDNLDNVKLMEDAGAAAVVFHSLFEEHIQNERQELHPHRTHGTESYGEALTYFPEIDELTVGPETYLNEIAAAKAAVAIPVIASLNGSTLGGWTDYAKQIEQAGADALELNIYWIPTDPEARGQRGRSQIPGNTGTRQSCCLYPCRG